MQRLTPNEILNLQPGHKFHVRLLYLTDPDISTNPELKWEGEASLHLQYPKVKPKRAPTTPLMWSILAIDPASVPAGSPAADWAEYGPRDVTEQGGLISEHYLMEIYHLDAASMATSATPASGPTFVGGYVTDIVEVQIAGTLSGQHVVILGGPGWGKTRIARALAEQMVGAGQWAFVRLDPSTPPEVVRGAYDPAALLQGSLQRIVAGTPYDPTTRIAILDEVFRPNDVMFDVLLDVLDRMDAAPEVAPVVWATANFVARGDRVEALRDRFGLWLWLNPDLFDMSELVKAHLRAGASGLQVPGVIPDWATVSEVRRAVPGPRAVKAVTDLLQTLDGEARAAGLRPHPRRAAQWAQIVFRTGMYHTGQADFAVVPDEASRVLRYAWPAPDSADAVNWAKIAASVVDPIGAAIEGVMAQAYAKFYEVAGIVDQAARLARMGELGGFYANAQASLKQIGGTDPRVVEANDRLTKWFAAAARGEMPVKNGA